MRFDLEQAVREANQLAGCQLCRGVRFKTCGSCGQAANSFPDHRAGAGSRPLYATRGEWREVNGEAPQSVPDRDLQPR